MALKWNIEWHDGDYSPRWDCPCAYCSIYRCGGDCDGGACAFSPSRDYEPNIEKYREKYRAKVLSIQQEEQHHA